ncbi:hypothetical protein CAAN3_08S03972 [[Candida] anglica]
MTLATHQSLRQLLRQVPSNAFSKSTRKAFLFSYLYVVLPRIIKHVSRAIKTGRPQDSVDPILKTLYRALHPSKFPLLVAKMIATTNVLTPFVQKLLQRKTNNKLIVSTIASFLGAIVNFPSFQAHIIKYNRYFSLDFTLILFTRALDTVGTSLFPVLVKNPPPFLQNYGDGLLFVVSSFFIMHYWFFYPNKLPPAYHRWITSAANVDPEIVTAFKAIKSGTLKYGEHCPDEDVFVSMCDRYGQDPSKGSLIKNTPLPCEVLHAFTTNNCELHALWRFQRGFKFAFNLYGTINFVVWLIRRGSPKRYLINTCRSSAFLGAFIALYWYSLCLARTRLLPKLFPNVPITRWDDTIAPAAGAMGCGFGCFIENAQRRKELSLFVAPRALGALVPSEPTKFNLMVERLAFSLSFMVLASFAKQDPKKVRGIMGKGLEAIFKD